MKDRTLNGKKEKGEIMKNKLRTLSCILAVSVSLSACAQMEERLANVGKEPELSPIYTGPETKDYKYVSIPMPPKTEAGPAMANSLWQADRKGFFKDQRAGNIGDILTVVIDIDEAAEMSNETKKSRASSENDSIPGLLGFESYLRDILPDAANPASLVNVRGATNHNGKGEIDREEKIESRIAAIVTEILPNGNLVITGRQEVRVNFEVRELFIAGIIRPEDIAPDNSIPHDKIAEARIAYGGKGQITDLQQARYGHQVFDILYPF